MGLNAGSFKLVVAIVAGNPLKTFIEQRRAFLLRATSTTPPAVRAGTPRNNPQRTAN